MVLILLQLYYCCIFFRSFRTKVSTISNVPPSPVFRSSRAFNRFSLRLKIWTWFENSRDRKFCFEIFFNWDFPVVRRSTFDEFFVPATLFITTGFTLTSFPGSELKWSCFCCWGSSCWKEDRCAKKFQVQDVLLRCIACCWNRLKYPKSIEL